MPLKSYLWERKREKILQMEFRKNIKKIKCILDWCFICNIFFQYFNYMILITTSTFRNYLHYNIKFGQIFILIKFKDFGIFNLAFTLHFNFLTWMRFKILPRKNVNGEAKLHIDYHTKQLWVLIQSDGMDNCKVL